MVGAEGMKNDFNNLDLSFNSKSNIFRSFPDLYRRLSQNPGNSKWAMGMKYFFISYSLNISISSIKLTSIDHTKDNKQPQNGRSTTNRSNQIIREETQAWRISQAAP